MCLILVAYRACERYPIVIAANRDESYSRPALPLDRWSDCPRVYGGRDLDAGGGWLGYATNGRYAALTNFRQGGQRDLTLRSRGELVAGYLCGDVPPAEYLEQARRRDAHYNGYSMLAGDARELYFHSNRGNGVARVTPGVHGLSNHLLDEPWPKVTLGVARLASWLTLDVEPLAEHLYGYLSDRTTAPDHLLPATGVEPQRERELSAAFIAAAQYGTRASSVVIVRSDGEVYFGERGFGPHGAPLYAKAATFCADGVIAAATPSRGEEFPLP